MRDWAQRVGREDRQGELAIVRGKQGSGKGRGKGEGKGKGKGTGKGEGEGKGEGKGKGSGKGSGQGKGEGKGKGLAAQDVDLNLPTSIIENEQNLVQETNKD